MLFNFFACFFRVFAGNKQNFVFAGKKLLIRKIYPNYEAAYIFVIDSGQIHHEHAFNRGSAAFTSRSTEQLGCDRGDALDALFIFVSA